MKPSKPSERFQKMLTLVAFRVRLLLVSATATSGLAMKERVSQKTLTRWSSIQQRSVNRQSTAATTDHYPLKDGYINEQDTFTAAVDATRRQIKEDGSVVVNCAAGISRSATVIATAIAAEDDMTLTGAIEEIRQTRGRARPHTKLRVSAQAYLKTVENREVAATKLREIAGQMSLDHIETKRICEVDEIPIDAFDSVSEFAEIDDE